VCKKVVFSLKTVLEDESGVVIILDRVDLICHDHLLDCGEAIGVGAGNSSSFFLGYRAVGTDALVLSEHKPKIGVGLWLCLRRRRLCCK
jgi:hypothetical protein